MRPYLSQAQTTCPVPGEVAEAGQHQITNTAQPADRGGIASHCLALHHEDNWIN